MAIGSGWVESICVVSRRWVWVESMGVASDCGCKEVDFLIIVLLILTPLVFALFCSSILLLVHFSKCFLFLL